MCPFTMRHTKLLLALQQVYGGVWFRSVPPMWHIFQRGKSSHSWKSFEQNPLHIQLDGPVGAASLHFHARTLHTIECPVEKCPLSYLII